jgi:hypothetical protein
MFRKIFVVFLILGLGFWAFKQKPRANTKVFLSKVTPPKIKSPQRIIASESSELSVMEKQLHHEATLIAQVDSDPEETEVRLKDWAHTLNEKDLNELKTMALNTEVPQDDRFLAVMLMGWSDQLAALENLKDIVLAEIDPYLNPNRKGDFERALRMQAIDGMISLPAHAQILATSLQNVIAKTNEAALADRANRALASINGHAPKPAEQDQAALDELLKKSKKK